MLRAEAQEIQIRRRIDDAQGTVDGERIYPRLHLETKNGRDRL